MTIPPIDDRLKSINIFQPRKDEKIQTITRETINDKVYVVVLTFITKVNGYQLYFISDKAPTFSATIQHSDRSVIQKIAIINWVLYGLTKNGINIYSLEEPDPELEFVQNTEVKFVQTKHYPHWNAFSFSVVDDQLIGLINDSKMPHASGVVTIMGSLKNTVELNSSSPKKKDITYHPTDIIHCGTTFFVSVLHVSNPKREIYGSGIYQINHEGQQIMYLAPDRGHYTILRPISDELFMAWGNSGYKTIDQDCNVIERCKQKNNNGICIEEDGQSVFILASSRKLIVQKRGSEENVKEFKYKIKGITRLLSERVLGKSSILTNTLVMGSRIYILDGNKIVCLDPPSVNSWK